MECLDNPLVSAEEIRPNDEEADELIQRVISNHEIFISWNRYLQQGYHSRPIKPEGDYAYVWSFRPDDISHPPILSGGFPGRLSFRRIKDVFEWFLKIDREHMQFVRVPTDGTNAGLSEKILDTENKTVYELLVGEEFLHLLGSDYEERQRYNWEGYNFKYDAKSLWWMTKNRQSNPEFITRFLVIYYDTYSREWAAYTVAPHNVRGRWMSWVPIMTPINIESMPLQSRRLNLT